MALDTLKDGKKTHYSPEIFRYFYHDRRVAQGWAGLRRSCENISGKRKYSCNYKYFESIDSHEKAYWLGFILADGCVMHHKRIRHLKTCSTLQERFLTQLSLSIQDYDHLMKFSKSLDSTYPINIYKTRGYADTKYGRILIEDKRLYESLISHGLSTNKTLKENFPYEFVPPEYYIDVLRGIFDADGCISKHKSKHGADEYEFTLTGTKEILYSFQKILGDTSNNKFTQRYPERKNNNYTLKHSGNQITYKYMNLLYENAEVYLERKYQKYLQLKQLINGRVQ